MWPPERREMCSKIGFYLKIQSKLKKKNIMLWHIRLLYKVKSLCRNYRHLIKIKENLLKANISVHSNILSPSLAISPLGTKNLDAFKCLYVAGRMDFSIYLDPRAFVSFANLWQTIICVSVIFLYEPHYSRDGLAEWTEYCIFFSVV